MLGWIGAQGFSIASNALHFHINLIVELFGTFNFSICPIPLFKHVRFPCPAIDHLLDTLLLTIDFLNDGFQNAFRPSGPQMNFIADFSAGAMQRIR